jgi:hypothetical protein
MARLAAEMHAAPPRRDRLQIDGSQPKKVLVLSENAVVVQEALAALQVGQVVEGAVSRLADNGAYLTLSSVAPELGLQGFITKRELSWDVVLTVDKVLGTGGWRQGWGCGRGPGGGARFRGEGLGRSGALSHASMLGCIDARPAVLACWLAPHADAAPLPLPLRLSLRPAGQKISAVVTEVDLARSRLSLSLRQMQADPLQETIESIEWQYGSMDEGDVEVLSEVTDTSNAPALACARLLPGLREIRLAIRPRARRWQRLLCAWPAAAPGCGNRWRAPSAR